jgi:hypothetical protein
MLASTAVTAAGQIQSGLYASQVARNQAQVAAQNKALGRENAIDAIGRGQDDQRKLGRDIAQRVGSQEARMAGNNTDLAFGSAARVVGDTRLIGAEDAAALADNTQRQVHAMQTDIWSYEAQRRAARSEAHQAVVGAAFGTASTILGGATQYARFRADYGTPKPPAPKGGRWTPKF